MTPFTRTDSGLSNLCLFHSVDVVIFIEGGNRSLSTDEIIDGSENLAPADIRFWKLVLDKNGFGKRYKLKAVGSKSSVRKIASKIVSGEVSNIAVTMDRDFDGFYNNLIISPRILYTDGYSWESDVYTKYLTNKQISSLLLTDTLPKNVQSEFDKAYNLFERTGARIVRIEMLFRSHNIAWISEARGEQFFRPSNAGLLDISNLRRSIDERKCRLGRPAFCPELYGISFNVYKVSCGKLLRALSVAVMRYICRKYADAGSICNSVITASMLERFGESSNDVRSRYYSSIVADLDAAVG